MCSLPFWQSNYTGLVVWLSEKKYQWIFLLSCGFVVLWAKWFRKDYAAKSYKWFDKSG